MRPDLRLEVVRGDDLTPGLRGSILGMCQRAFEEDLVELFATLEGPTHVLGFVGERLASHALWVTRWLQAGEGPSLRTAYVEMVATEPTLQRRGYASAVMRRVAAEIQGYDLGALDPAEPDFYERLGWSFWRGPLSIRTADGILPTPDERVMVLRLPGTPALDIDLPLSAEWRAGELW